MGVIQAFKLAVKSLAGNKMRAFLTMLGIIIGVAAVIILVSLMQGLTGEVTSLFSDLGTDILTVSVQSRGASRTVDDEDFYEFYAENDELFSAISPNVNVSGTVKQGTTEYSSSVKGVSEEYMVIEDYELAQGRFISYADIEYYNRVCVIGSYLNKEVYNGNAVGETIKVVGNKLTIVGVLEETDDSSEGSGDDIILLPYSTACKIGKTQISTYSFCVADTDNISYAEDVIDNYLYNIFNSDDYYTIINMQTLIDQMEEMIGMMTMVLVGIAGISLLVGGIGIMNVLFVSVKERTSEIGILKSLGASRKTILLEFLLESAAISLLGGILGVAVSFAITPIVEMYDIRVEATMAAWGAALGFAVLTGTLFGFYPAWKASRLVPVEALNAE